MSAIFLVLLRLAILLEKRMNIPELVNKWCTHYSVDARIVAAMILQESGGNPLATRFEPKFYSKYVAFVAPEKLPGHLPPPPPDGVTVATEKMGRAHSFGLMQIMGSTARSPLGFKNNNLAALYDPDVNIELGVRYLSMLLNKHKNMPEHERYFRALAEYNGSTHYPPLIYDHIKTGRHLKFLRQEPI